MGYTAFIFAVAALLDFFILKWKNDDKREAETEAKAQEAARQRLAEERMKREAEIAKKKKAYEAELAERKAVFKKELERKQKEYENEIAGITSAQIVVESTPSEKLALSEIHFSNITKKSNRETLGNFVAVDVETTGLSVVSNEIVDIAAIRFKNFAPVEKFEALCYPKHGIQPEASRINGITSEMVEGKPHFRQIAKSLQSFIGSDNLVGHNLEFDLKFIEKNGVDITSENRKYFDTLALSKTVLKKNKYKRVHDRELDYWYDGEWLSGDVDDYKLTTICSYLGIQNPESHRAFSDALAAGKLFGWLTIEKTKL